MSMQKRGFLDFSAPRPDLRPFVEDDAAISWQGDGGSAGHCSGCGMGPSSGFDGSWSGTHRSPRRTGPYLRSALLVGEAGGPGVPFATGIQGFTGDNFAPSRFGAAPGDLSMSHGKKKDEKKGDDDDDDGGGDEDGPFLPPVDFSVMPCPAVLELAENDWAKSQKYYAYAENAREAGAESAALINEAFAEAYAEESEDAMAAYDAGDCVEVE